MRNPGETSEPRVESEPASEGKLTVYYKMCFLLTKV